MKKFESENSNPSLSAKKSPESCSDLGLFSFWPLELALKRPKTKKPKTAAAVFRLFFMSTPPKGITTEGSNPEYGQACI